MSIHPEGKSYSDVGSSACSEWPSCRGVYVAFDGPLDQHFMAHPERLFSRPIERAAIDPTNPQILEAHVACAAHELALDPAGGTLRTSTRPSSNLLLLLLRASV